MSVFPSSPHLATKKVSRSPDIDKGRTMSMFCRPANYSSFYQLLFIFMSHKKTYHQALAPLLFEFELQIISNILLPPRPRLVVRTSLSCFYLLPLRTPARLELFQIILNTVPAHPNIFYSFGSFCIFFFLIFCLQSTRVCM